MTVMTNAQEYFAEGVQSFFNVNAYAKPSNGIHNHVATNQVLKTYDPELYNLIKKAFPCQNKFVKRCEKSRTKEESQELKMDCNEDKSEDDDGSKDDGNNTEKAVCIGLDPAWKHLTTATLFPVHVGTPVSVSCPAGFQLKGSNPIICSEGTTFISVTAPYCEPKGRDIKTTKYVKNSNAIVNQQRIIK